MRIGLAQINPKVGDFASNTRKILKYIEDAKRLNRELLVFPELSIPGYPPRDLLDYSSFIDANLKALEEVAKAARGITVICGFVEEHVSKWTAISQLCRHFARRPNRVPPIESSFFPIMTFSKKRDTSSRDTRPVSSTSARRRWASLSARTFGISILSSSVRTLLVLPRN